MTRTRPSARCACPGSRPAITRSTRRPRRSVTRDDGGGSQSVTVANGTNCSDNLPGSGATATFTNAPLSDIQVNFRDGGSGETSAVIDCDNDSGSTDTTPASGWDTSTTVTGVEGATTITCTIVIDP